MGEINTKDVVVLIVDDTNSGQSRIVELVDKLQIAGRDIEILLANNFDDAIKIAQEVQIDLVIADYHLNEGAINDKNGAHLLTYFKEHHSYTQRVIISGALSSDLAGKIPSDLARYFGKNEYRSLEDYLRKAISS